MKVVTTICVLLLAEIIVVPSLCFSQKSVVAQPTIDFWLKPPLRKGKKKNSRPDGALHQGIVVNLTGKKTRGYVEVIVEKPIRIRGWLDRRGLGCVINKEVNLHTEPTELGGSSKGDGTYENAVVLRKGCIVRILKKRKRSLKVKTVPRLKNVFITGDENGNISPSMQTVATGFITEGWIPAEACSYERIEYFDSTTQEGQLGSLRAGCVLYKNNPAEVVGGEEKADRWNGRVLSWTRWIVIERFGNYLKGHTDEPVEVGGYVNGDCFTSLPNTNPLNMIFLRPSKGYEMLVKGEVKSVTGSEVITTLKGGTGIFLEGVDYDGCIIRTKPPVEIRGKVDCRYVRNLDTLPEIVMDSLNLNKLPLDRNVTFPQRGPKTGVGVGQAVRKKKEHVEEK